MPHGEKFDLEARAAASPTGSGLEVISRLIVELTPDPTNPRVHAPHQVRQIAQSIQAFGFNVPVLIDAQDRVIAGHGRVLAAKTLGFREVPTICLGHLTDTQRRAFQIADNRLTENATWDKRLLGAQLKALAEVKLEFNLDVTGFAMAEIDMAIEGLTPATAEAEDPADAIAPPASGPAVSRSGDLWLLGPHRSLTQRDTITRQYLFNRRQEWREGAQSFLSNQVLKSDSAQIITEQLFENGCHRAGAPLLVRALPATRRAILSLPSP